MKRWVLLSIALLLLASAASLAVWVNRATWLPEQVPTHWGISGEPDAFTPREHMGPLLILMPALLLGMMVLGLVLPWLSPVHFKIETFQSTYDYIMGLIIVLFAYLHAATLLAYTGVIEDVSRWIVGGSLLLIALLGNVLGKVQRNFWIGVRTPWTLASDTVWIRTHRLAAWLFVSGGLVGFVLVMAGVNTFLALSVFGIAAIVPVFYSLWLYKHLEKQGLLDGQTQPPATN